MKKQAKTMIVAVSVCLLLISAYIFAAQAKRTQLSDEEGVVSFEPFESAETFSLIFNGEHYDFTQSQGVWFCSHYDGYPINTQYIEKIRKSILEMSGLTCLPEHDELSVYGISETGDMIEVTSKDGAKRCILLGSELPYREEFYLKEDEFATVYYMYDPEADLVFTEYSTVIDYCTAPADEMVDFTRPNTFKLENVESMTMIFDGSSYRLQLNSAENYIYEWQAEKDGEPFEIEQDYATAAVRLLRYITPVSCVQYRATAEKLSESGVSEPYAEITVVLNDGNEYNYKFGALEGDISEDDESAKRYMVYNNTGELTLCYEENISHFISFITDGAYMEA